MFSIRIHISQHISHSRLTQLFSPKYLNHNTQKSINTFCCSDGFTKYDILIIKILHHSICKQSKSCCGLLYTLQPNFTKRNALHLKEYVMVEN